jgi:hypothetical protein
LALYLLLGEFDILTCKIPYIELTDISGEGRGSFAPPLSTIFSCSTWGVRRNLKPGKIHQASKRGDTRAIVI